MYKKGIDKNQIIQKRWEDKLPDDTVHYSIDTGKLDIVCGECTTGFTISLKAANNHLLADNPVCPNCRRKALSTPPTVKPMTWDDYAILFTTMRSDNKSGQLSMYKLKNRGYENGIIKATDFMPDDWGLNRRCWHIENNTRDVPKCPTCKSKSARWRRYQNKLSYHYCSRTCQPTDEKATLIEKAEKKWSEYFMGDDEYEYVGYQDGKVVFKHITCGVISTVEKHMVKTRHGNDNLGFCTSCWPVMNDHSNYRASKSWEQKFKSSTEFDLVEYKNGNDITIHHHKCGTNFKTTRGHVYDREYHNANICLNCQPIYSNVSSAEAELCNYIKSKYGGEIIENDRVVLAGKELDVYLPQLSLAFEFNGTYWHSTKMKDKTNNRHQKKSIMCESLGIELVHIWSTDWTHKKSIVESLINNKLKLNTNKIHGRNCKIKPIEYKECRSFLINNHLFGAITASVYLGLYHGGILVSVMTFSRSMRDWELTRYASKLNVTVHGGASKLLMAFEKSHNPTTLTSFAFNDFSNGGIYKILGFENMGLLKPNYFYVDRNDIKYNRRTFSKASMVRKKIIEEAETRSEFQIMDDMGYYRVYNSGIIKFIKTY